MDPYEATKIVFSRIQHLDPENASKIMGLLLIQDHGEKEMIRLAFGPESLLHSLIFKSRQDLGISQNTPSSSPSTPPSPSPFLAATASAATTNNPLSLSRQNSASNSSRLFLPNGLKIPSSLSISSLASPSSASSPSWPDFPNPDRDLISPNSSSTDPHLIEELHLQEQLSFLNENTWAPHRRSCSVSDISVGDDPSGALAWKPCLYYARGFCKNGSSCRFLHGGGGGGLGEFDSSSISGSGSVASMVGSPSKMEMMEQCHELLRSKSMQHQKLVAASQLMAASSFPFSGSKCLNFLVQQQQQNESQRAAAAAALMMGEDMHKFSRSRLSRGDYLMNGDPNPGSRQIYLTFPADSTFKEEDVSNYFSIYGPVQDVRIPYQQKRMFGFVTFVYPETVKIILAKGNPHFVCDARVLVKPYKEKGKVPDKFRKQQQQLQQLERGEFSACNSPTGLDNPRDPFDNQLGSRMMYNATQEMLWRKKLEEQNDFQQALELQSRRLMGLQLDIKRSNHHRALSTGAAPFPSPTYSPTYNQPFTVSDRTSPDRAHENGLSPVAVASESQLTQHAVYESDEREKEGSVKESSNGKESPLSTEEGSLPESLEHNLPDSPFASPTKGNTERQTAFTNAELPSASGTLLATSALDLSPFKSCYFQMPRFSTGPGAIGM